jgi:tetratricopeptide (TPR) repeat protein
MKRYLIGVIIFLVGFSQATTLTVCPDGCDYASIQAAIDAANTGDIIEVYSGLYDEQIAIDKNVTLRGIDTGGGMPFAGIVSLNGQPESIINGLRIGILFAGLPSSQFKNGMSLGNITSATGFERVPAYNPEYAEALWYNKGIDHLNQKNYEEAVIDFDMAIEINPKNAEAWYMKSVVFYNQKRYEDVIKASTKAIEIKPNYAIAWNIKGNALGILGKYEEALHACEEAIRLDPESAMAWSNKGISLAALGKYKESLQCYEKSLNLDQNSSPTWNNKGWVLANLGMHEEALQACEEAIRLDPRSQTAWSIKGSTLDNMGRHEEALQACEEAIRLDPNDTISWSNEGAILVNLGMNYKTNETERANAYFNRALIATNRSIDINPKFSPSWNNKGEALRELNIFAGAAMAFSISRALDSSPPGKYLFFILMLIFAAVILGYLRILRSKADWVMTAILVNVLGFLAFLWILSSFFDPWLLAKFSLIGSVVAILMYYLYEMFEPPESKWKEQVAYSLLEMQRKYLPGKLMSKMSWLDLFGFMLFAIIFFSICVLFFFSITNQQERTALEVLRHGLLAIIILDLLAVSPLIVTLQSENLSTETRNMLFVCLFAVLLINSLLFIVYYWSWDYSPDQGLALGDISLTVTSGVFVLMLLAFVLLAMAPYITGWRKAKKWRMILLEKRSTFLDKMLDILELGQPAQHSSCLTKMIEEIESHILDFRGTYFHSQDEIVDRDGDVRLEETICGPNLQTMDPRLCHLQALRTLKNNLSINIKQLEGIWGGDASLMQKADELARAYRIRKAGIIRQVDVEKKTNLFLFFLSPIIYSVITVILNEVLRHMIESGNAKEAVLEMAKIVFSAAPT